LSPLVSLPFRHPSWWYHTPRSHYPACSDIKFSQNETTTFCTIILSINIRCSWRSFIYPMGNQYKIGLLPWDAWNNCISIKSWIYFSYLNLIILTSTNPGMERNNVVSWKNQCAIHDNTNAVNHAFIYKINFIFQNTEGHLRLVYSRNLQNHN
jgi:hypothetical protein